MKLALVNLMLCLGLSLTSPQALANEIKLPRLGDTVSGIVSKRQEYELGRTWLKAFRSRVREHDDPLMQQYFRGKGNDLILAQY